jgi:hypothetical protein
MSVTYIVTDRFFKSFNIKFTAFPTDIIAPQKWMIGVKVTIQ